MVQTFTTHPTELYRLTYEVRGPPESGPLSPRAESGSSASVPLAAGEPNASQRLALFTETLGVTAPHPFWVCNNEPPGFIAAEDLRVGDVLFVGEGKEAVVTRKVLEHAPPGETFTTYNFEVEDFHTYFVGKAGVWVHNASARWICETSKETYLNLKQTFNGDHWKAFYETIRSQRRGMNSTSEKFMDHHQTKIYNEVLDDFLAEGGDLKKAPDIPNSEPHEWEIDRAFREQRGEKVYGNPRENEPGYGKQPDRLIGAGEARVEYKKVSSVTAVETRVVDALEKENTQQIVFYTKEWAGVTDDLIREGVAEIARKGKPVGQIQKWWIYDGVTLRELIL